jgi:hypothetical protein
LVEILLQELARAAGALVPAGAGEADSKAAEVVKLEDEDLEVVRGPWADATGGEEVEAALAGSDTARGSKTAANRMVCIAFFKSKYRRITRTLAIAKTGNS